MRSPVQGLQWRYATKKFDTTKKLSPEQLEVLLECLRLSPSSFGLQPWKFIVVTNPEIRSRLREAAWGQPQVTDASHLVVFAAKTDLSEKSVDEYIQSIIDTRGAKKEDIEGYSQMMKGSIQPKSAQERTAWATRQAYIALGVLITAAAIEQIDVAPMEGFDPARFDSILGLSEKNLTSVVIAGIGFRSPEDQAAAAKKVRFDTEDVVIELA